MPRRHILDLLQGVRADWLVSCEMFKRPAGDGLDEGSGNPAEIPA